MTAETLLIALENSRESLLVALEPLSDEALLEPRTLGEWSVADALAHLVVWESELVTALLKIDQGKKPQRLLAAYQDVEGFNHKQYAENQGRALDRIFDDLHGVRIQLEAWLDSFSDRDLTNPKRFKWAQGRSLEQIILECSANHEMKHLPQIQDYTKKWLEKQPL
jgi:hypothetical protein